ncbi:unnamed protein product [Staurois parvus]|uniref:Uncharacterized protein n=1 Tax=Staurois parvus TaxID=386267 RepID=A0ABN9E5A5_9NEOB|nr:unnamed protein product [Staurois parvus]
MFDPVFSDPPLLPMLPSYLLIRHIMCRHKLNLVCIAREVFFSLGECM